MSTRLRSPHQYCQCPRERSVMRSSFVLVLIGAVAVAVVGGSSLHHRQRRQTWTFPEEPDATSSTEWTVPSWFGRMTTPAPRPRQIATESTGGSQQMARTSTKPPGVIFQVKDCACQAPPQYNPVCGSDGNTYVNRQKLECARRCGFEVEETRMGAC